MAYGWKKRNSQAGTGLEHSCSHAMGWSAPGVPSNSHWLQRSVTVSTVKKQDDLLGA